MQQKIHGFKPVARRTSHVIVHMTKRAFHDKEIARALAISKYAGGDYGRI